MYGLSQFTMVPPNQPPKTIAAEKSYGNTLLTDFFNRGRLGRPKRVANLAGDVIAVARKRRKPGPAPKQPEKPPPRLYVGFGSKSTWVL